MSELVRMQKEAVMTIKRYYTGISLEGLRKTKENYPVLG
jgi:hypothetical protein